MRRICKSLRHTQNHKGKKLRDLTQESFFYLQKKSKREGKLKKKPQSVKCVYKNDQRLTYLQHGKFI